MCGGKRWCLFLGGEDGVGFFEEKTAYGFSACRVGSDVCIKGWCRSGGGEDGVGLEEERMV